MQPNSQTPGQPSPTPQPEPMQPPQVIAPTTPMPETAVPAQPVAFVSEAAVPAQPVSPAPTEPAPVVAPTPQVTAMPPAGLGQPQVFQAQPAIQPMMQPAQPVAAGGSKAKPLLFAGVGILGVFILAGLLYFFVLHKPITAANVLAAQKTADSASTDMNSAIDCLNELQTTDTASNIDSSVSSCNTKLAAAQKDYATLKQSPVLRDKAVDLKFKAVDAKWSPFVVYMQNNLKDAQNLVPILLDFTSDLKGLPTGAATKADLVTALGTLKTNLDTLSTKLSSVKLLDSNNKDSQAALETFMQSASQAVATSQSDIASGKSLFTAEDDLFKIDDAASTLDTAINAADTKANAQEDKLNPGTAFVSFQEALNKMSDSLSGH